MWLSSMCCMRSYRFLKHRPHLLNLHSFNRNTAIYPSGSEQRWIGPSSRWLLLLLLGGGRVLTVWLSADHYWREAAATTGRARGGGVLPGPPADRRHSPPPTDARAPQNRAAAAAASSWRLTRPCVCVCVTRWSKTGDLPEEDDRETETDLNFIAFVFFPTRFPTPKRRIYYYCELFGRSSFSIVVFRPTSGVTLRPFDLNRRLVNDGVFRRFFRHYRQFVSKTIYPFCRPRTVTRRGPVPRWRLGS